MQNAKHMCRPKLVRLLGMGLSQSLVLQLANASLEVPRRHKCDVVVSLPVLWDIRKNVRCAIVFLLPLLPLLDLYVLVLDVKLGFLSGPLKYLFLTLTI